MSLKDSRIALGVATAILFFSANAQAATVDFTDTAKWSGNATGPVNYGDFSVKLTATPSTTNFNQAYDGGTGAGTCEDAGKLKCLSDGAGVTGLDNDEISFSDSSQNESLLVSFVDPTDPNKARPVTVTGLYFLDLFKGSDGNLGEQATVSVNGGTSITFAAIAAFGQLGGYAEYQLSPLWLNVSTLLFTKNATNDGSGSPDYALAGIDAFVSPQNIPPIPIPAALPLLASALSALGFIGWRRKHKAQTAAT